MSYTYETISQTPATLSENLSRMAFYEATQLWGQGKWRCYVSNKQERVDELVSRFMNKDARVPSAFGGETIALVPNDVLRFTVPQGVIEGWLYTNGAVIVSRTTDVVLFLFIDEEWAALREYPATSFIPVQSESVVKDVP